MPRLYHDEFSGRTDLNKDKKYKLRHPDRYRKAHAAQMRSFRDKNPESCEAATKKYRRKIRERAKLNSHTFLRRSILGPRQNRIGKLLREEILNLHRRGKSVGLIAISTRVPVSIVVELINLPNL